MIQDRNELWEIYNKDKTEASYRLFKVKRIEVNMACNDAKILYQQQVSGFRNAQFTVNHFFQFLLRFETLS